MKTYTCKHCKATFEDWPSTKRQYCSPNCSCKAKKKVVIFSCSWCSKTVTKTPSLMKNSKSGLHFCDRQCKAYAQSLTGGMKEIQPDHYGQGTGRWSYRKKFKASELVCYYCGYCEHSCSIEIHHIDHNRKNNEKKNLMPLCANCHKAYHCGKIELK